MGGKIPLPPYELFEASLEAPEQRSSSSRCLEGTSPRFEEKTRTGNYLFLFVPHHLSKDDGEGMDGLASLASGTAAAEFGSRLRAVAMA